jgi:hypothetical protein
MRPPLQTNEAMQPDPTPLWCVRRAFPQRVSDLRSLGGLPARLSFQMKRFLQLHNQDAPARWLWRCHDWG